MNRFLKFHPFSCFSYFFFVIFLSMTTTNIFVAISFFVTALISLLYLDFKKYIQTFLKFVLPLLLIVTVINGFFNHSGETVLFYYLKSIPFTFEALMIGLRQGLVFSAVIMWFMFYEKTITSNKFLFLFSKIAPNTALLVSMVFRFIPLFSKKAKDIRDANKGLGNFEENKFKNSVKIFSTLISESLESSVETATAMKARGFGKKTRKPYSRYVFSLSDFILLLVSLVLFVGCFLASKYAFVVFLLSVILGIMPFAINIFEDIKWNLLRLKI